MMTWCLMQGQMSRRQEPVQQTQVLLQLQELYWFKQDVRLEQLLHAGLFAGI